MVNSREITDIKSITISSKSCKFTTSECIMEARFGRLTLSIPDMANVMVVVKAKKISGNGKIFINDKVYAVQSKLDELEIPVHERILEIQRTPDAIGEVAIVGLTIYHDTEGEELKKKWKSLISKCGEYKSIRMVDDRLYAAAGACFLNGRAIKSIETNPPGMTYFDDGVIKFRNSCEITDIVINESAAIFSSVIPEFIHRDIPTPIVTPPPPLTSNPLAARAPVKSTIHMSNIKPQIQPPPKQDTLLLYDSVAAKEFDITRHGMTKSKTSKFLKSNGRDYLVLKKGGSYSFPVSFIRSSTEYTVVIASKKLNGNGRLQVGFMNDGTSKYPSDVFIVDDVEKERLIRIKTEGVAGVPRFSLSMPDSSVGEILIKSVRIYNGSLHGIPDLETAPLISDLPEFIADEALDDIISIRNRTRYAATLEVQPNNLYTFSSVFGYIEATSFNTKLWLSRVLGMFPNIQPIRLSTSSYVNRNTPDVILTSLDTLKVARRIWLEEFRTSPTKEQVSLLDKANTILTPSLTNSIELKALLPNKKIEVCPLVYPCVNAQRIIENYAVYFEDNVKYTELLLKSWKEAYPKLVVVGSNMKLSQNMKHMPEYESYPNLFDMISKAKFFIELSAHNHFDNGLSDICYNLSIPVITNNHHYLLKNGYKVISPSIENLRVKIEDVLSNSQIDHVQQIDENYSKYNMLTLLGKQC